MAVVPDAAGAAVHEQPLTGCEAPAVEYVRPHREVRLWQCGGVDDRHAARNRQALHARRHTLFGVSAAAQKRADLVSDLPEPA
jgi:hypothetical protein